MFVQSCLATQEMSVCESVCAFKLKKECGDCMCVLLKEETEAVWWIGQKMLRDENYCRRLHVTAPQQLHLNSTLRRGLEGSRKVIPWISSGSKSKLVSQLEDCSLLDRYDTVSAWGAEPLWDMEAIIKFKRSIKMSGFYQVRWEGEWLCGLRGQVNYSEVDCPGLLVRRSGLDTVLCPRVITASHFSILALFIMIGEKRRPKQVTGFHLYICLHSHTESQIIINVLKGITLWVEESFPLTVVFFAFSDMNQGKLRVCERWLVLRSQGHSVNFLIQSQSETQRKLSLISNPQEPWKNQNTVSMLPSTCLFSLVVG